MTIPERLPGGPRSPSPEELEAQFDELVRKHYAEVCRFIHRHVGSEATAEDLAQDLFLRLWERRDHFDFDNPEPYLYRAARNRALSELRHDRVLGRWRRAHTADPEFAAPPSEGVPDDLPTAIAAAIESLPERCRLIFTMSREQGMSYRQIATRLGLSIKTVETQMGRALRVLRAKVAPYL